MKKNNTTKPTARRPILICEDDEGIRDFLEDALQDEGYDVDTASNGREALKQLEQSEGRYLVLLDLLMPEISGYDILERMHRDPRLRGEHVVLVISATGFARPMSQGIIEGIVREVLKKPFDLDDLLALVKRWA